LIFADHSPGIAMALLLMSFFITFGSAAMGTAIMGLGQRDDPASRGGTPVLDKATPVQVKVAKR
jgi:hypothetical protein